MAEPIRFVMVGGFLGAGKTTLIGRLARAFQNQGKHVCIVTNDQAAGLVDTKMLQSQGFEVNEVAGSCFCCNFDGLTDAMEEFDTRQRPDVILAEPVGSCTDLIATIAIPMTERLGERFVHSPYAVVLKPSHGLKILTGKRGGFSPKAEYIFRKQLEESELIVLNRIDELSDEQVSTLRECLADQYPGREVIGLSAKTGQNVEQLYQALQAEAPQRTMTMDVDYDIYAEGEAELGWLNATCTIAAEQAIELDEFSVQLVEQLRTALAQIDAEPAHLKVFCSSGDSSSVANLVSSDSATVLSEASGATASQVDVTVNARVCASPEQIEGLTRAALDSVAGEFSATATVATLESFRPGRPVPTHRAVKS